MQKIIRWYDNVSIKSKLTFIIFMSLLLLSFACIVGIKIVTKSNQELLYHTLASSLSYSAMEIRDSMEEIESLSFQIIIDSEVQKQLAAVKDLKNGDTAKAMQVKSQAFQQLNTILQNYYSQNRSLQYISISGDTINVDTNTIWAEKIPDETRSQMYQEAVLAEGRVTWRYEGEPQNSVLAMRSVRRISPYTLDTLGVVVISIRMNQLIQSSADFSGRFGASYYLLTHDDRVLYCSEEFPLGTEETLEHLDEGKYMVLESEGRYYFAVAGNIPDYGWRYVHLILYDDMHYAVTNSYLLYILVVAFSFLLAMVLCNRLVKRLTKHISALIKKMDVFSKDNEQVPVSSYDYSHRSDEVGLLHQRFDKMAGEIVSLIQNDYTNQLLMKDARLKALEAQIDPHFLYNTLQSISWSAKAIGDEQIPKMVDALGKMLRTKLSAEDELFTIGKEKEFILNYMTIQEYRFEGSLDFQMEIPDSMDGVRIPKLSIQPLIENSIRYAMESGDELCYIQVFGRYEEDEIIIEVKNTGSVFEDNLLEKLENHQISPNGFGIGLLNIQKRLHLYGGDSSYLALRNEDNMAVAAIHLPNICMDERHGDKRC